MLSGDKLKDCHWTFMANARKQINQGLKRKGVPRPSGSSITDAIVVEDEPLKKREAKPEVIDLVEPAPKKSKETNVAEKAKETDVAEIAKDADVAEKAKEAPTRKAAP